MNFTLETLNDLRQSHAGWTLLRANNVVLIVKFLHRMFLAEHTLERAESYLIGELNKDLAEWRRIRNTDGEDEEFSRTAKDYLASWADKNKCGWLRSFYQEGKEEPFYEITSAAEKAILWIERISTSTLSGATESGMQRLIYQLIELNYEVKTDDEEKIRLLELEREKINKKIESLRKGEVIKLDDAKLQERFREFEAAGRQMISDINEVKEKFRALDREIRERIAFNEDGKGKGKLVESVLDKLDEISESPQGKSYRACYDYMIRPEIQETIKSMTESIVKSDPIKELKPEQRTKRLPNNLIRVADSAKHEMTRISKQLNNYCRNQTWQERRQLTERIKSIRQCYLALGGWDYDTRARPMSIPETYPNISLPFEMSLHTIPVAHKIDPVQIRQLQMETSDVDLGAILTQVSVNPDVLISNILDMLETSEGSVTLGTIIEKYPLTGGLTEFVSYLNVATKWPNTKPEIATETEIEDMKKAILPIIEEITWESSEDIISKLSCETIVFDKVEPSHVDHWRRTGTWSVFA